MTGSSSYILMALLVAGLGVVWCLCSYLTRTLRVRYPANPRLQLEAHPVAQLAHPPDSPQLNKANIIEPASPYTPEPTAAHLRVRIALRERRQQLLCGSEVQG